MRRTTVETIAEKLKRDCSIESLVVTGVNDISKQEKEIKKQKKKRFDEKDEKKCRQLFMDMNSAKTRVKIRASCQSLHDQYIKNPFDYESFKTIYAAYIAGSIKSSEPDNCAEPDNVKKRIVKPTDSFLLARSALAQHLKTLEKQEKARLVRCDRMREEAQMKMPDAFTKKFQMLYVRVSVNGVPTIAFIDSGAHFSLIGLSFAKKANLDDVIDRRFRRKISGVGGADIMVGQIHSCIMKIGSINIKVQLDVINHDYDVLIGLDILRLFRGSIDLEYGRLTINDLQSFKVHTKFLAFDEIEKWEQENIEHRLREKKVDEEKLTKIFEMGYDKVDAENALREFSNDLPNAVCRLYKRKMINWAPNEQNGKKYDENLIIRAATATDMKNVHIFHDIFPSGDVTLINDNCESTIAFDNAMENRCRQLFKEMSDPLLKLKMYANWRPLHDLYIKKPSDYESFKCEFAKIVMAQKNTRKIISDSSSKVGKIIKLWKWRLDNWNLLRAEASKSIPTSVHPNVHLYIQIVVKGVSTIALVDSGATRCSMSMSFIKKAGLEDMIDPRDRPTVKGFGGTAQKAGMIYMCSLKIGYATYEATLSVENKHFYDVLIGLDFLKRHNCVIDVEKKRICINEITYAEFVSEEEVLKWRQGRDTPAHNKFEVDEAKLNELIGMGFKNEEAENALKYTSNDIDVAVRCLYYSANAEFVKTAKVHKKELDFTEILNPMGIFFE